MYREPAGGMPTFDRTLVIPGVGVGPGIVGRVSADEVVALFGTDCRISRHEPSNEIFEISYAYANEDDYAPDRPLQLTRPATFNFEFGLCQSIEIGVYQQGLATREGVRIHMPRPEVLRLLGQPTEVLRSESIDSLRYVHLGIEIDIDHDDEAVMGMTIFRARW